MSDNDSLILDGFFTKYPDDLLSNGSFPFNASLLYSFPSGNLNWTTPRADLGMLAYDPSKTNMWAIGKTVDSFFHPSVFSYPQQCIFPISGQYGFLPRLLYYVLLIFSLILRKHTWLSTAALGTAMTFAASASVHAFALLVRYARLAKDELQDTDLYAIFPILVAGSIMLTPILNFSTTVRKHEAHSVIIFWGVLLFCALVPTFFMVYEGFGPSLAFSQVATCELDVSKNCTFEILYNVSNGYSLDKYNKCNCNDTCGEYL